MLYRTMIVLLPILLLLPGCAGVKRPVPAPPKLPRVRVGLQANVKTATVSATGEFQISIKGSNRKPKLCRAGERWTFLPGKVARGEKGI